MTWGPVIVAASILAVVQAEDGGQLAERVARVGRDAPWTRVAAIPVGFRTFHPQGMVKIGDRLFVSSVEVRVAPRRTVHPDGGEERTAGEGVGHLFQLDASTGRLIAGITLGEGAIYHPGGLDFDGTSIWVPVAEYRPHSRSIVYRVDSHTMKSTEVFRFTDHLGAIVVDADTRALHGISWGSRRFYSWPIDEAGRVTGAESPRRWLNTSHYVDYQDCKHVGARRMLCTGITEYRLPGSMLPLGGVELVDMEVGRPLHQAPVPLWTSGGIAMTRNPSWFEATPSGLRAYFMPEDDESTIYVYEVGVR